MGCWSVVSVFVPYVWFLELLIYIILTHKGNYVRTNFLLDLAAMKFLPFISLFFLLSFSHVSMGNSLFVSKSVSAFNIFQHNSCGLGLVSGTGVCGWLCSLVRSAPFVALFIWLK